MPSRGTRKSCVCDVCVGEALAWEGAVYWIFGIRLGATSVAETTKFE